jgi:hypothetical protein
MTKDPEGKPSRQARWLWRYRGPGLSNYRLIQRQLIKLRQQPKQELLVLEPGQEFPPRLRLKLPFRPKRPTLVPRIRLIPPLLHPPLRPGKNRSLPIPLRLPLLHALLSFVFLALLPQHPLSIPTALGLAFAVAFYIHFAANQMGYRWRKET